MEKPYQLSALGKKIAEFAKQDGMQLAEGACEALAKSAYFGLKSWVTESAALSSTPIDDMVVKFLDHADSFVLAQIGKIDLDKNGT